MDAPELKLRSSVLFRGEAWTVVARVHMASGPDFLRLVRLRIVGGDDEVIVDPARDEIIVSP